MKAFSAGLESPVSGIVRGPRSAESEAQKNGELGEDTMLQGLDELAFRAAAPLFGRGESLSHETLSFKEAKHGSK